MVLQTVKVVWVTNRHLPETFWHNLLWNFFFSLAELSRFLVQTIRRKAFLLCQCSLFNSQSMMFSRILIFPGCKMNTKRKACLYVHHIKRIHENMSPFIRFLWKENINIYCGILFLKFKRPLYESTLLGCVCGGGHVCSEQMKWCSKVKITRLWWWRLGWLWWRQ